MGNQQHRGQMAGTTWDPALYQKFDDHRSRPGLELLDRIRLGNPTLIYDLGCGTGDLTKLLADRWPDARVVGVDNSAEMLAKASAKPGRVEWIEADIRIVGTRRRRPISFSRTRRCSGWPITTFFSRD